MVSDKSGTMSASAKSTLRCRVWPCDGEGCRCLSSTPTPTLGSEPTLEPRYWMLLADSDTGELTALDMEVSGVSGKYGDAAVDVTGLC